MYLLFHPMNPTVAIYPIDIQHMYEITILTFFFPAYYSNVYASKRLKTTKMFL